MHRKPLFVILWVVATGLAACGSSNKVSVTTTDFHFSPESWTVGAGQEVTVTVTNNGALRHEWVVIKPGQTITLPFNDDDEDKVLWEVEVEPGETVSGQFTAPSEPGDYEVVCGVLGHLELGMKGTLTVK